MRGRCPPRPRARSSEPSQKVWPTTEACWSTRRSGAEQRVEPGGEHGVDGLGQGLDVLRPLLADPVDHLLGEQRVARRALGDLRDEVRVAVGGAAVAAREQGAHELARLVRRQRLERDRGRVAPAAAPARAAVEQLVAGQADDQDRARAPSGPGTRSGRAFPRPPSGCPRSRSPRASGGSRPRPASGPRRTGGRASAAGPQRRGRRSSVACSAGGSMPSGRAMVAAMRSAGSSVSARRRSPLDPVQELGPGQLGVVGVDDLELAADDLAERPVGEPGAVGRAVPDPEGRPVCSRSASCVASSRSSRDLPTPAWPITVTRCGRPSRTTRSKSETSSADSSSRPMSGAAVRVPRAAVPGDEQPHGLPCRHRLGLALQRQRLELLVLDRAAGQPVGDPADGDAAGPGRGLQPRGDVDRRRRSPCSRRPPGRRAPRPS